MVLVLGDSDAAFDDRLTQEQSPRQLDRLF